MEPGDGGTLNEFWHPIQPSSCRFSLLPEARCPQRNIMVGSLASNLRSGVGERFRPASSQSFGSQRRRFSDAPFGRNQSIVHVYAPRLNVVPFDVTAVQPPAGMNCSQRSRPIIRFLHGRIRPVTPCRSMTGMAFCCQMFERPEDRKLSDRMFNCSHGISDIVEWRSMV